MAGSQSVAARLRLAARPPRLPVPKLAATHPASTLRPMSPVSPSRSNPPRVPPVPMKALAVPENFPRYEAPAIGEKGNPLPRYMFRPQRQAFVDQIRNVT